MRTGRKIGIAATVIATLTVFVVVVAHYQARSRLNAYKRDLIAAGEKLELKQITSTAEGDAANAGARFLRAAAGITNIPQYSLWTMYMIQPGHATVFWKQEQPLDPGLRTLHTNIWPLLRAAMEANESALRELRSAVQTPLWFPVNYSDGRNAVLPQWKSLWEAEQALAAAALLELHDGKTNEAFEHLQACMAELRSFPDDKILYTQKIRAECGQVAWKTFWEALQFNGWSNEQLASMTLWWEDLDFLKSLQEDLIFERNKGPQLFVKSRQGINTDEGCCGSTVFDWVTKQPIDYCGYYVWKWIWSYDDECLLLEMWQQAIHRLGSGNDLRARMAGLMTEQSDSLYKKRREWELHHRFPMASGFYPAIECQADFEAALNMQTCAGLCSAAVALRRYFLRQHQYPTNLAELVPQLLKQVPCDYMDGKPIRYHRKDADSFLLYSVGKDGKDDGGVWTPERSPNTHRFFDGRDLIWPSAASDDEVEGYVRSNVRAVPAIESFRKRYEARPH